ncbi:hypothetical protein GCM10009854_35120 [Saccharopolyspora halophila]|uniref:Uncharacterized protein n=1 Tax=Saccharopolyspora halophila TaxID=405551 RepID=A0ABP5TNB4_9PSEU
MQHGREHPSSCEKANGDTCECTHCAGAQHGWVGAIRLVRQAHQQDLRSFEREADRIWYLESARQEARSRKNPKPTLAQRKAAIRSACANLLNWLRAKADRTGPKHAEITKELRQKDVANPARALAVARTEVDRVEALGEVIKRVPDDVEARTGPLGNRTRRAMADHFWCELLVQLIVLVEEADRALDSVPGELTRAVTETCARQGGAEIERAVVEACVDRLWEHLRTALGLTAVADAKALLPALRTLAVLICKSPARHPAVLRHCVDPLGTVLVEETKQRLQATFGDLVPQIASGLAGAAPQPR